MERMLIWLRYFLHVPGLPRLGDPVDADCIVAQAFGRNTYNDFDLAGIRAFHDQHGGNDATTLDWLRTHAFDPGRANRQLAHECQSLTTRYAIPAIMQWEIAAAMERSWWLRNRRFVVILWPPADCAYVTARAVLEETVATMRQRKLRRPILVAHRWMIVRVFLMLRRLLSVDPIVCLNHSAEFDPRSVQPWTANPYAWLYRESRVRIHHLKEGWV